MDKGIPSRRFEDFARHRRRQLLDEAATHVMLWWIEAYNIPANITSVKVLQSALDTISAGINPVTILTVNLKVSSYAYPILNEIIGTQSYVINPDNTVTITIFAKFTTPHGAINEVNGAAILNKIIPNLAPIRYIYPIPADQTTARPEVKHEDRIVISIYKPGLLTFGQILDDLFTDVYQNRYINMMFERIAQIHAESVIHGDLFFRNIVQVPEDEQVHFIDTEYVKSIKISLEDFGKTFDENLRSEVDPDVFGSVIEILQGTLAPKITDAFPIFPGVDKESSFRNFRKRAFLYDIARVFESEELEHFSKSIEHRLVRAVYRYLLTNGLDSYLSTLRSLSPDLFQNEQEYEVFKDAVYSLSANIFAKPQPGEEA